MRYRLEPDGRADRSREMLEANELVNCEVCGRPFTRKYRMVKGRYSDGTFVVMKCHRCGLIFISPRINSEYREFCYKEEKHLIEWFLRSQIATQLHANQVLERLTKLNWGEGTLLEVGCGIGTFLSAAQAWGFTVSGVELNRSTAEYAAKTHRVLTGDFEKIDFNNEKYDVVVLEQTLEHLGKPLRVLQKVHGLLRKDGLVYIGVPRVDWMVLAADLFFTLTGSKRKLWSPEDHLYYYTPHAMKELLTAAGFNPIALTEYRLGMKLRDWLKLSPGQFYAYRNSCGTDN